MQLSTASHTPQPPRAPATTALSVHQDALRRLIRRRGDLPPQSNLTFASIFYNDCIFTQVTVGSAISHSRWRIARGDLVPFHASDDELRAIALHLHNQHGFTAPEIAAALDIDLGQAEAILAAGRFS